MPPSLPIAPAPWSLRGEGWIIPLHTPFSAQPIPLQDNAYAPLESGSSADQSKRFHGGVGFVMLVRYKSSDVGSYDELLYVPGLFSRIAAQEEPNHPVEYFPAITRIYVSTNASVYNGRKNWGIPKHRADFTFTRPSNDPRTTLVRVSLPDSPDGARPFFACKLRDSAFTPFPLPVSTTWFDSAFARTITRGYSSALYQLRLPSHNGDQEEGAPTSAETSSEKTFLVKPTAKGWSRLSYLEPHPQEDLSACGDGENFPRIEPYSTWLNFHLPQFEMEFPIPLEV
ncbi:hypothetical protein JCM10908_000485 [Rhodotorula pacifica]|uniref:uncharacterized protein n=1 Tax=Rhodotorula pacifica TaxID=1495444 RepID=UPI0031751733